MFHVFPFSLFLTFASECIGEIVIARMHLNQRKRKQTNTLTAIEANINETFRHQRRKPFGQSTHKFNLFSLSFVRSCVFRFCGWTSNTENTQNQIREQINDEKRKKMNSKSMKRWKKKTKFSSIFGFAGIILFTNRKIWTSKKKKKKKRKIGLSFLNRPKIYFFHTFNFILWQLWRRRKRIEK